MNTKKKAQDKTTWKTQFVSRGMSKKSKPLKVYKNKQNDPSITFRYVEHEAHRRNYMNAASVIMWTKPLSLYRQLSLVPLNWRDS